MFDNDGRYLIEMKKCPGEGTLFDPKKIKCLAAPDASCYDQSRKRKIHFVAIRCSLAFIVFLYIFNIILSRV